MGDRRRPKRLHEVRDRVQGDELSVRGANIQHRERRRIHLVLGLEPHNHPIFVHSRVDGRDLALAVSVKERVFDLLRRDAERRSLVAVDHHVDLRVGNLQVARDVLKAGKFPHLAFQFL